MLTRSCSRQRPLHDGPPGKARCYARAVTRKKRKQLARAEAEAKVAAPKPAAIGTGLAGLLEQAGLDKLKKPEPKKAKPKKAEPIPVTLPAPGPSRLYPVTDPPPPLPRLRAPHNTAELSALNQ